MTVRAKLHLSKELAKSASIVELRARTLSFNGELRVQVEYEKELHVVSIKSTGRPEDFVDLLTVAPASAWKGSGSLLSAVKLGYLAVSVVRA